MISACVLHFGNTELLWECMEITDCECTIDLVVRSESKEWHAEIFTTAKARLTADDLSDHWAKMVAECTKLSLTHPYDRLAAIAGCAKPLGRLHKGEYLAGL